MKREAEFTTLGLADLLLDSPSRGLYFWDLFTDYSNVKTFFKILLRPFLFVNLNVSSIFYASTDIDDEK